MSFFTYSLFRGSIRSSAQNSVRYNIRAKNSKLFTENRFFHTHNTVRPTFQNHGLKAPTGRNLFRHYLNAPGNLLFLTTNLLGLGILVTYKGLSTIAHAGRIDHQEQYNPMESFNSGLMGLDYSEEKFNSLKRKLMERQKESEEDEDFNEIMELQFKELEEKEEEETAVASESLVETLAAEEAYALPLTEMDLNEYGPPIHRTVKEERFKALLIDQLLSVYCISDYLDQVFLSETPNIELLESLSKDAKEGIVNTLYGILLRDENAPSMDIKSFEEFFKNLPLKSIHHFIEDAFAIDLKNELLQFNDSRLKDEALENITVEASSKSRKAESFQEILDTKYELNSEMYLNVATELISSKGSSTLYETFIEQSNENTEHVKDRNLKNLTSVLNSLYFHTGTYKNEKFFNELMKSSVMLNNKKTFYQGLKHLNIDENSLQNDNWKISKKARNHLARRSKDGYQFSIDSYIIALQGLLKFNASIAHIKSVVDKILKGLTSSGTELKVSFKNGIQTKESSSLLSKIPVDLFELFIIIASEYKDNVFLTWCFQFLNKHHNGISTEVYSRLYQMLKQTSISLNDRELLPNIDKTY